MMPGTLHYRGVAKPGVRSAIMLLLLGLVGCSAGGNVAAPFTTPVEQKLPDPATTPLDQSKAAALQAVLTKVVSQYAATPEAESASRGITAAVVSDKWSWSGAAGTDAAGVRLTPSTSTAVASITKTFVAAEVLLLAKSGRINLDAPLSTYVKHRLTSNGATVRQHLAMRSGLPNYLPADYTRMDEAIAAAPARHWTSEQILAYDTAPSGKPDSEYNYSNPSYVLLGMLIEKVTGQPMATVLRRDLAKPAGLEGAAFQDAERPQPPIAEDRNPVCGKGVDGFLPCRAIASLSAANAGLAADAPTVARWGYQLYGGCVVPADVVGQMTAGDGEYGLGTMLFSLSLGLETAVGHQGDMPDFTSLMVAVPEKKVSIAILLADGNKNVKTVAAELLTAVQQALD